MMPVIPLPAVIAEEPETQSAMENAGSTVDLEEQAPVSLEKELDGFPPEVEEIGDEADAESRARWRKCAAETGGDDPRLEPAGRGQKRNAEDAGDDPRLEEELLDSDLHGHGGDDALSEKGSTGEVPGPRAAAVPLSQCSDAIIFAGSFRDY